MAYYMNLNMLAYQYGNLLAQPDEIKKYLRYIVVDDGSPTNPAIPPTMDIGVPVEIYRMKQDIPWNQDACRNLAAKQAPKGWLLLTDMDHVPTFKLIEHVVYHHLDPDTIYTFTRVSAPDMQPYKSHPNSWLMTRDMYFKVGGYDERFRGIYGTDGMFKRRACEKARRVCEIKKPLIRFPREVVPDASTTTLTRKSDDNDARKRAMLTNINKSGDVKPVHFLTPWEQVA